MADTVGRPNTRLSRVEPDILALGEALSVVHPSRLAGLAKCTGACGARDRDKADRCGC